MINFKHILAITFTALRGVLFSFLLLKLSGCTTINTDSQAVSTDNLFKQNLQLKNWQLQGKIGIRTANDAISAYINWQQCGDNYDIRLNGPLGIGSTRLYGNLHSAVLVRGNGPTGTNNPQQLLQQQLGWAFPIEDLLFWAKGLPAPSKATHISGQSNGFQQNGWLLNYGKPIKVDTFWLPSKTKAEYIQNDEQTLKLTLISRKWHLSPDCEHP